MTSTIEILREKLENLPLNARGARIIPAEIKKEVLELVGEYSVHKLQDLLGIGSAQIYYWLKHSGSANSGVTPKETVGVNSEIIKIVYKFKSELKELNAEINEKQKRCNYLQEKIVGLEGVL